MGAQVFISFPQISSSISSYLAGSGCSRAVFMARGLCTYFPYLVNLWGGLHLMTVEFVCMELFYVFFFRSRAVVCICCVHRGVIVYGFMALMLWIGQLMSLYDMFELER